jgi:hypothetical protein
MIVSIQNAEQDNSGSGWSGYVLGKNNNRKGAKLIYGDTELGDAICESVSYRSGNYVRFVISFTKDDNVTPEQGRVIAKEWLDEYMIGFSKDEYHIDLVEHQDTSHLHYHGRIPKVNLLTSTQLKVYYHKADLAYKIAVNEYIAEKHNLTLGVDKKRLVLPPQEKEKRIAKWRKEHEKEPYNLSNKKGRAIAEEGVADLINDLNVQGLINSLDDVKAELLAMDFTIPNEGYDKGKGFHYITIQQGDNKLRLKGDIFGRGFYEHSREDRAKAISDNKSIDKGSRSDRASGINIEQALHRERQRRLRWIGKQYGNARKQAVRRLQEVQQSATNEHSQNTENVLEDSSPYRPDVGASNRVDSNLQPHEEGGALDQDRGLRDQRGPQRNEMDRGIRDNKKQGEIDNDRARTEAFRRIIVAREAKRERTEILRRKLEEYSEQFNQEIPTVNERDLRASKSRAAVLNSTLARARETTDRDYQAIEEATSTATVERSVRQDFNAIIPRIRTGFSQIYDRIKQAFDRRAQELIVGVANVANKNRLFEQGKKKFLSHLRQKKIKQVPRR